MAGKVYIMSDGDRRELRRMRRKTDSINGPGVVNTPESVSIAPQTQRQPLDSARHRPVKFDGILGSATLVSGATTRWAYPFSLAKYDSEGTYTAVSGGLTGTAYNKIEAGNTGSGVEGCGINVDNLPTGWELKPIGAGAVVEISVVVNCDDDSIEYVFQAVNNADGACP